MDLAALFMWHREQQERFAWLAEHHKTTGGGQCHRDAVTRRNLKLAQFHGRVSMGKVASDATVERVFVLMQDGKARTSKQAADELHLTRNTVNASFAWLHKRKKLYLEPYVMDPTGHNWTRVFRIRLGQEKDAVKPTSPRGHSHAYQRRERERLAESRASGAKIFRHPWDVWLFGERSAPPRNEMGRAHCAAGDVDR